MEHRCFFFKYIGQLERSYKGLFGSDEEPTDKKESNERTDQKVARGWSSFIYFLAKDNILDIDKVTKIELITAYNFLAHIKSKNDNNN